MELNRHEIFIKEVKQDLYKFINLLHNIKRTVNFNFKKNETSSWYLDTEKNVNFVKIK